MTHTPPRSGQDREPADRDVRDRHPAVVLALDAGQTGTRARLVTAEGERRAEAAGVLLMADTTSVDHSVSIIASLLHELGGPRCDVTVVGTTGFSRLPGLNARLARAVADATGSRRVVVAHDSVTSHTGALASGPGIVAAVGTGVVVCVRDVTHWLGTLDGHGPMVGDRGSGHFIGAAGLRFAARCRDLGDTTQPLLAAATGAFGPVEQWSSRLRGTDATTRIASFASRVLECAADGDPVAGQMRAHAADELATTVAAAARQLLPEAAAIDVSWTGSLLRDDGLRIEFLTRLTETCPRARPHPPHGTALDGALHLAVDPHLATALGYLEVHDFH